MHATMEASFAEEYDSSCQEYAQAVQTLRSAVALNRSEFEAAASHAEKIRGKLKMLRISEEAADAGGAHPR